MTDIPPDRGGLYNLRACSARSQPLNTGQHVVYID